jgi:Domain of unknown function (DUF3883)
MKSLQFELATSLTVSHFVQYHNTEKMGGSPGPRKEEGPFSIVTRKSLKDLAGSRIWLIAGVDQPRKYSLWNCFEVDTVQRIHDKEYKRFKYSVSGRNGASFRPPIPLNEYPWFKVFRKAQANFSLGLNKIDPETVKRLVELATTAYPPLPRPPAEGGGGGGAGFGTVEMNRQVEAAAVSYATAHYSREGWSVTSVEAEKIGYDLLCRNGRTEKHVEVKGVQADEPCFIMTERERNCALADKSFVVCVVVQALSRSRAVMEISRARLAGDYEFRPVSYVVSRKP